MAYSVPELQALAQELIKHPHVAIISDDIYEHHLWRYQPFQNLLNVCPDLYDQFILINSLSKNLRHDWLAYWICRWPSKRY